MFKCFLRVTTLHGSRDENFFGGREDGEGVRVTQPSPFSSGLVVTLPANTAVRVSSSVRDFLVNI